jgi:DNA-binding winged helix-turn-helix (wHTH) protein
MLPGIPAKPLRFGCFEISPAERVLRSDDQPVAVGARAFDLLLALLEHRDRVVTKQELLDLVWPGLVVEEHNLQVHVSTLRKLLGPHAIATIPGRGYRFTLSCDVPDTRARPADPVPVQRPAARPRQTNIHTDLPPLYGRAQELADVRYLVREHRLVTLTGTGGIGKTQLARAVAHELRGEYADQFARNDFFAPKVRAESAELIDVAVTDPAQRERWRREGAALDEAAIVALCLGE